MTRYVWNGSSFVLAARQPQPARVPMIIRDHMEPLVHPCTGQLIDSKSAFRAVTRENGCRELGNDAPVAQPVPQIDRAVLRADIATAIEQVEQGFRPPETPAAPGDVRIYGK